ncbi:phenylalanine N-monooxygenase [Ranunculus cassubicifolius]
MMNTKEKLPHDLVIEILSWLHVKHLCPLRFVSKTWLHLLTKDTQFAKLQFDRYMEFNNNHPDPSILGSICRMEDENDSNLIFATEFESIDEALPLEYPFYQPTNRYIVCGISNGLLCISRCDDKEVYVWNPLINDHISISCLPAPSIRFPGYRNRTRFGFGFDQDSNVYKVVRFFNEIDFDEYTTEVHDKRTKISVYTIGVDSMWRTVEVDIPHDLTYTGGALVNGVLHWHTYRPGMTSWDLIVTFDVKEEVIGEFLLPHGIKFQDIVELSGFLCAIDRRINEQETQIWVMKEYGVVSSWSKQYIIEKPEGYIPVYHLSALGVTRKGEIVLSNYCENLVLYNPETNTIKDLKGFRFAVFLAYPYLGSIISPTAISQAGHNLLEEKS